MIDLSMRCAPAKPFGLYEERVKLNTSSPANALILTRHTKVPARDRYSSRWPN